MNQYPDKLIVSEAGPFTQDNEGNLVPHETELKELAGRYEVNDRGGYLPGNDGNRINYSGIFYTQSKLHIQEGASVKIQLASGKLIIDTIKQYSQGQLNTRIWL